MAMDASVVHTSAVLDGQRVRKGLPPRREKAIPYHIKKFFDTLGIADDNPWQFKDSEPDF